MSAVDTPCREYRGSRNEAGYGQLWRRIRGKTRRVMLHRWVVEQVEGPLAPWPDEVVMHLCDNPPCFRYDHLRRASCGDNIRDANNKGRRRWVRGIEHPNAKLDDCQVAAIRELYGGGPTRLLAERFGVSPTLIRKIGRGEHRAGASCEGE